MTTRPGSRGDGAHDGHQSDSTAAGTEDNAAASYSPRKFGQLPRLIVPENFDEQLTDAQISPWEFRSEPTNSEICHPAAPVDL